MHLACKSQCHVFVEMCDDIQCMHIVAAMAVELNISWGVAVRAAKAKFLGVNMFSMAVIGQEHVMQHMMLPNKKAAAYAVSG